MTGLIQALGTTWGLFRHYWVLIKLVITIVATALLLLHMLVNTTLSVFKPKGLTKYGRRKQRELLSRG